MATKKDNYNQTDDDGSGKGGASGEIVFKDFLKSGMEQRDDLLTGVELRNLLAAHKDTSEGRVKKQKELRDQRADLKAGKQQTYEQQGYAAENQTPYKPHPALMDKAQFSGIDRQVNALPTINAADTNEADRNELDNQYRQKYELEPKQAPSLVFSTKLKPPGL